MPAIGAPGSVSTQHGGPSHALNSTASPWANPWHRQPSEWRAQRGTTVTDAEIKSHKAQATLHDLANATTLADQRERMESDATSQAKERANYNQLNFINRALHASKPHLRAPTTQGAKDVIAAYSVVPPIANEAEAAAVDALMAELTALLRALFDGLDIDGDGTVSYKEWTETLETNSEWTPLLDGIGLTSDFYVFDQMDTDGDGRISWEEFNARLNIAEEEVSGEEAAELMPTVDELVAGANAAEEGEVVDGEYASADPDAAAAAPAVPAAAAAVDPAEKLAKIAANKISNPDNLACKNFDVEYYNGLSDDEKPAFLACVNSGVENADSGMGCYAMQPADFDRFNPFFKKVLAQYHGVDEDAKHVNSWSLEGVEGLPEGGKLDLAALGLPELSMRVRVGRNLKEFPLPGAMTQEDRVNMEAKMCAAFDVLKANPKYGGGYNSLTPGHANFVDQAGYQALVDEHIMFKDMAADSYLASAGIASDWPHGRGCYVSEDRGFIIWVGEEDHLRIMCMKKASVLNDVFDRLKEALDVVNGIEGLEFAHSEQYGMVTSCPTNLGTGMRASVHIPIPNLTSDGTDTKAKEICKPLGLSVRGTGGEHTPIGADGTCDISPSARFCITEAQIITALYNGLKLLKEEEAKASA